MENCAPNITAEMKLLFFGFKMFAAFIYYFRRNFRNFSISYGVSNGDIEPNP